MTIASALPSLAPAEDQHPAFLLVAILAGLYSTYLFRGGRFVIWFW